MYVRVLQDELQFPDDRAIDQDTKSLIRGVRPLLTDGNILLNYFDYSCFNGTPHSESVSLG